MPASRSMKPTTAKPTSTFPLSSSGELFYLNEKKGKPLDFAAKYARLVKSKQFVLLSFYPNHVLDFDACAAIPEMHDRIIVGAARRMNAKLLTQDKQIKKSGLVEI